MHSIINIKNGQESRQSSSNFISNLSQKVANPELNQQASQKLPKPPRLRPQKPKLPQHQLPPHQLSMPQLQLLPHQQRMPALLKKLPNQRLLNQLRRLPSPKPPKPKRLPSQRLLKHQKRLPKHQKLNQSPRNDCECGFFIGNSFLLC